MAMPPDRKTRTEAEAAQWLARMRGEPSQAERRSFIAWYNEEPEHRSTYDRLAQLWDMAPGLELRSELAEPPLRGRLRSSRRLSIALAALLVLCAAGAAIFAAAADQAPRPGAHDGLLLFATEIGEIRTVPVTPGLEVTLDTDSAIRLSRDRRRLRLERGRARVSVQPSAGGVVLEAGPARVDVGQAVLDVRLEGAGAVVTPIAGEVAVAPAASGARSQRVAARQSLAIAGPGVATLRPGPDRSIAWPSGMLEFEEASMSAVVAEANRYGERRIRLAGPELGSRRVTGAFRAGDLEGLARSLAAAFRLDLVEEPDGDLLLRSRRE